MEYRSHWSRWTYFIRHQQGDSFLEEDHRRVGVTVEGGDVHEGATVLGPVEDGGLELVGQELHGGRVPPLSGQVHRSAI